MSKFEVEQHLKKHGGKTGMELSKELKISLKTIYKNTQSKVIKFTKKVNPLTGRTVKTYYHIKEEVKE